MNTAVERAYRRSWPEVLAATIRVTRDLDLAEDCVQGAFTKALQAWAGKAPDNPVGWLTTTARNLAIDHLRREQRLRSRLPYLVMESIEPTDTDDPLRLVFLCCHPSLARAAQVALTLRLVCGLSVGEIAAGLLVKEATVAARITRAKHKITAAAIPFRRPPEAEFAARLDVVLDVVHLVHTAGHTAADGDDLIRPDLSWLARDLARRLAVRLPHHSEVQGLLGLVLLDDARQPARLGATGELILMEHQDRSRWDRSLIRGGLTAATAALRSGTGRFALLAAISGLHCSASSFAATDWSSIGNMYDGLWARWPSPVVALNRLAAISMLADADLDRIIGEIESISDDPALGGYPYLPAVRADVLRRLGRRADAAGCYREAIQQCRNRTERAFLQRRLDEMLSPD